jgi:hypothetical protein
VPEDESQPIVRPAYLSGPASWELRVGHHDEISDVFLLGMVIASLACGLDLADTADLRNSSPIGTTCSASIAGSHPSSLRHRRDDRAQPA